MRRALRFQGFPSRSFVAAGLSALLCLGVAPAAIGCGFLEPLEVPLEGMYPGSFPVVAVALRKAADQGVIDAAALEAASRRGEAAYGDTVWRLQSVNKALAASPAAAKLPPSFSLGCVESQRWARISRVEGSTHIDIHTVARQNGRWSF